MNAQQSVEEALILLEQMSEDPNEILKVLNEAEQSAVMQDLNVLAEQAATIQSGADLLSLVDTIHRLVEDRPGLKALLLPEGIDVEQEQSQRTVTLGDQQVTTELDAYAQQRAPQIHNTVIECRTQLEAALQKKVEAEHKPTQGKSHDDAKH
jgi:hypothetical protein